MTQNTKEIKVFVTNLGKYNEGELIGEWLDLPATDDDIAALLDRIGINERYEEYFITDCETDIEGLDIGEYESLDDLNDVAAQIMDLDDSDIECIEAMLKNGSTFDEALAGYSDCTIWPGCLDMTDVAYAIADITGLLDEIPERLRFYFDYEAYGRDLGIEGCFIFLENGDCVEICR